MANIDPDAFIKLTNHYMLSIVRIHGERGIQVLQELLQIINTLYEWLEPEQIRGEIIVFKTLDRHLRPISEENALVLVDFSGLTQDNLRTLTIQVLDNGQFILWKNYSPNILELSEVAIVYEYHDRSERFVANYESRDVIKIDSSQASMFAKPTFSDLKSALEEYRTKMVRYSSCPIFHDSWFDGNRIFFKNGPEFIFRNSLTHFLKARLRGGVEVRPEQNVDESHPVDIKVTWMLSNRLALIEIKWLGKSRGADGGIAANYTDYRAREGAQQLADYLDMNRIQAPDRLTRGYLLVVDGRRYNTNAETESVTRENGLYYQDREINYNPKYHEIRTDFEIPTRMFSEPLCLEI